jgi:acyl carrier protein
MENAMNEIEENLQTFLVRKSAEIVAIEEDDVLWEADIDEFGFASMEVNKLCVELNERFGINMQPVIFLEVTSLQGLSQYLLSNYPAEVERRLD